MVRNQYIDWICIGAAALASVLAILLMFGEPLGIPKASASPGYAARLFDDSRVHTIDIEVEDWGAFVRNAESEEYAACTVVIDGEEFHNIGLRAKGNNSLRLTEEYGLSRYSLSWNLISSWTAGIITGWTNFLWTRLSRITAI